MGTARRWYLVVVSAVSLLVLAIGAFNLVGLALAEATGARGVTLAGGPVTGRDRLSLAVALIAVGGPTFAIHWWLIVRGRRGRGAGALADRRSPLRAVHLGLVSSVALATAAVALATILERVARVGLGLPPLEIPPTEDVALLAVAAPTWWLHRRRRDDDLREDVLRGSAAWLSRLVRYGWLFVGVMLLLTGLSQVIDIVASTAVTPPEVDPGWWRVPLAEALALVGTGVTVTWLQVAEARRTVADADRIGEDDRATDVRLAYFGAVILVALASAGLTVAAALTGTGRQLLGVADETGLRAILQTIVGPLLVAIPYLAAGWLHRAVLRAEAAARGPDALAAADRLVLHLAALVGIVFLAVGAARLGGLALEVTLTATPVDDELRRDLVWAVAQLVVGVALWTPAWRAILRRRAEAPQRERSSATARTYLLLILGGALVAGIPSAVFVVYRVVDTALGGRATDLVADLAIPLSSVVVAAILAAGHGRLVVADQRLAPTADTTAPTADDRRTSVATRTLDLRGAAGDVDRVVEELRGRLPDGVTLDER